MNYVLSVMDMFTKRITFVIRQDDWKAINWAPALLDQLNVARWKLSAAILSDRDPKFVGEL